MSIALEIAGLAKSFAVTPVLRAVTLAVPGGQLTAILGASGSGKSTLLRLIAGFESPDAGMIKLDGALLADAKFSLKPERRQIGYVAQDGALFPHLNVADNITFGLPRAERRARHRVAELLDMVDLPISYGDRPPQALSGGEQQRVALARALARNPKLLLLDEPFSALDAALRVETRQAVAAAIKAAGATAILVTHDQEEALSMGAEVGVLQNGVLAQLSTPEALYRRPASAYLAGFVGDAVLLPATARDGQAACALGTIRLAVPAVTGAVQLMIRPEQIKVFAAPVPGAVAASVKAVTFYGHDAAVSFAVAGTGNITARLFSHALPAEGAEVWLRVDGDAVAYEAVTP